MLDRISIKQIIAIMTVVVIAGMVSITLIIRNNAPTTQDYVPELSDTPELLSSIDTNYPDSTIFITINVYEREPRHAGSWDFWVWTPDGTPGEIIGGGGGRYSTPTMILNPFTGEYYPFLTLTLGLTPGTDRVGFLMRLPPCPIGGWDVWGRQTGDVIAFLDTDAEGNPMSTDVYHIHGTNMVTPSFPYMGGLAVTAIADWHDYIRVTMLEPEGDVDLSAFELRDVTGTSWENGASIPIRTVNVGTSSISGGESFPIFHVYTYENLNPQHHYELAYGSGQTSSGGINVLMRGILDKFDYDGWLGHRCDTLSNLNKAIT